MRHRVILFVPMILILAAVAFTLWRGILIATPAGSLTIGIGGLGYTPLAEPWTMALVSRELPLTFNTLTAMPLVWRSHIGLFVQFPWWIILAAYLVAASITWRIISRKRPTPAFPINP